MSKQSSYNDLNDINMPKYGAKFLNHINVKDITILKRQRLTMMAFFVLACYQLVITVLFIV